MSKISLKLETEKRLIQRAQKRDKKGQKAFEKLYQHYAPHIRRFFRAQIGKGNKVEDLTSQVFEKALEGLDSFRWQGVSVSAWFYKIAKNVLVDFFRQEGKLKGRVSLKDVNPASKGEGPEEYLTRMGWKETFSSLISQLPQREQKIIYLKFYEGRTNKSIAKEMGLSETNVGTIVYRVVKKLRRELLGD